MGRSNENWIRPSAFFFGRILFLHIRGCGRCTGARNGLKFIISICGRELFGIRMLTISLLLLLYEIPNAILQERHLTRTPSHKNAISQERHLARTPSRKNAISQERHLSRTPSRKNAKEHTGSNCQPTIRVRDLHINDWFELVAAHSCSRQSRSSD